MLFGAGIDSSLIMTEFILFMLGKKPDLQETLYNELKQHYDRNKISSINNCPLFRAFIQECFRKSQFSALGLPHYTKTEIKVTLIDNKECYIPKNSIILANYLKIAGNFEYNRDKYENWENSKTFNINHFLDDNRKFKKNESQLVFSVGKRDCLGRSLAYKLCCYIYIYLYTKCF